MFRFLFDECMSPSLAGFARDHGYHALHVNWANLSARRDELVALYAISGDYVFVTNNGVDFRPIYRSLEVHPGLIVIVPSVKRSRQIDLFAAVLRRLEAERDMVNKLIEVDAAGIVTITDLPSARDNIP